mmetsp:Transcript_32802/g.79379  ORF Transcript_32802/g.79379 Transcript_32802/m.79379 type:complete len:139 (-) Transcript_32802:44-460(-)
MQLHRLGLSLGAVQTVTFDVGGRIHRVTESMLKQHHNTLLGRLAAKALKDGTDDPIFIDRDGDLFLFVLNFLREGEVDLPMTVPRKAFMAEIRYYGIAYDWGSIRQFGAPSLLSEVSDLAVITLAGCLSFILVSMKKC